MSATTAPQLNAPQARALHRAEVEVTRLKTQLAEAEKVRDELRERYRELVPLSADVDERVKGIRAAVVGNVTVRIHPMVSGERFSWRDYKLAGHPVTDEMRAHIHDGKPWDKWTVKDARGPAHLTRVEPRP